MVRLLITRRESTEYDHVIIRNLEKTAPFQAYPVRVLFYFQVQRLPVIPLLQIEFLNQVRPLTSIETGNNIKRLVVEGESCVEVSACVQVGHLCPGVCGHVINFALIHTIRRQ